MEHTTYRSKKGVCTMAVDFSKSKTRKNLMRAFAGESQARNRYTIAAKQASRDNLYSISQIFLFTADAVPFITNSANEAPISTNGFIYPSSIVFSPFITYAHSK